MAYILNASDLHPVHQHNMMFKHADDTDLLVPDIFSHTVPWDLQYISDWAKHHNVQLNQTKSLEIIITVVYKHLPPQQQHFSQELIP